MSKVVSIVRWISGTLGVLGVIALCLVGPIDRTPLEEQDFYVRMMAKLNTLTFAHSPEGKLQSDWAKVNITPAYSMPMAGYTPRPGFDSVHDSLYARVLCLSNGYSNAVLVNVDLLLFPPLLKERIEAKLAQASQQYFLYLAATHTHNGIGGWDDSTLGHMVLGSYNDEWIEKTANDIVQSISNLKPVPSSIKYWESDVTEWIENRIAYDKGEKDGRLRGFSIERTDGKKFVLFTLSAHATSIGKRNLALSADYPAEVIRLLESENDFGMFMAGMVGSHRFVWSPENDFKYVTEVGGIVYNQFQKRTESPRVDSATFTAGHIPIDFGPSQMRIAKNWKVRDWVFRLFVNPLHGELTFLEIGNLILIGTPCDFSGEIYVRNQLDALARTKGKQLIITSFNGDYNGYITYDGHYDSLAKDEVRVMNWVGPYHGRYFSEMIGRLIEK